jgi:hypothetical protein
MSVNLMPLYNDPHTHEQHKLASLSCDDDLDEDDSDEDDSEDDSGEDDSNESDDETPASRRSSGSFALGVIGGFLGGLILIALVMRRAKPETRRGLHWGLLLQILFGLGNLLLR